MKIPKFVTQPFRIISILILINGFCGVAGAQEETVDPKTVERLERLIKQQQQQLESLQEQLNQLKQTASDAQTQAEEAKSVAQEAKTTAQAPVEKTVTSGQERVKLAISGQVNRAVNLIDDGKNTELYFVDNDTSNTRVRFVGTAKATDDLTLGSRLEFAVTSNESGDVSQDNEDTGDFFNTRWADLTLASKRLWKDLAGPGQTRPPTARLKSTCLKLTCSLTRALPTLPGGCYSGKAAAAIHSRRSQSPMRLTTVTV